MTPRAPDEGLLDAVLRGAPEGQPNIVTNQRPHFTSQSQYVSLGTDIGIPPFTTFN